MVGFTGEYIMKKLLLPILMLISIIFGALPVTACADSSVDTSADDAFSQKVDGILKKKSLSGSFLVVKNGQPIYQTNRGYADHSTSVYNNRNTTFEIDSVQKSMTAAMIMKEVQNNNLSLFDTLSDFYPEIPGSSKITIRQMLDMTSGLTMRGNVGPDSVMSDTEIIDSDIGNIRFSKLMYNKWNYQAINYNLLSGILEKITGKSYKKLFTETFIKKLNLKHTIFAYDTKPNIEKAVGYSNINPLSSKLDYKNAFDTKKAYQFDEMGTGQIYMNASDLYKVEKYIMSGSLLTAKSRQQLFTPGSQSTYGGGMYHGTNENFANGWGYGYQTVVRLSDNGKNGVIALQNYQRVTADIKPIVKQVYGMIDSE